jgi:hypothetical protein
MAQLGLIVLRQHRFTVSIDLSRLYVNSKTFKIWIRIYDLDYDMWGYQGLAAITHPLSNILDMNFNTRSRADLRCACVMVEVAEIALIPASLWFEVHHPNGWVSNVRIIYEIEALKILIEASISQLPFLTHGASTPMPSPTGVGIIVSRVGICTISGQRPAVFQPSHSGMARLPSSTVRSTAHLAGPASVPVAASTATSTLPVQSQSISDMLPTRPAAGMKPTQLSLVGAFPPLQEPLPPAPQTTPTLPPTNRPSSFASSQRPVPHLSKPPLPKASVLISSQQHLSPKPVDFKKQQKNKVWYKNKCGSQHTAHHNLLEVENKALKAQLALFKAIGQSAPVVKDSSLVPQLLLLLLLSCLLPWPLRTSLWQVICPLCRPQQMFTSMTTPPHL